MKTRLIFTCSTINSKYLFSKKAPWKYVSLDPAGNNLTRDIKKLIRMQLVKESPKLFVILGNTDPYYIYTESFCSLSFFSQKLLWKKFDYRWRKYKQYLNVWLSLQGLTNFEVISWRELEFNLQKNLGLNFETLFNFLLPRIDSYFTPKDFAWELKRLRSAFTPNGYFPDIPCPNDSVLRRWIRRKFTEYMLQGLFLYIFFPGSTLLQNEQPTTLRNKMYQPLIKKMFNAQLRISYPFGIDDAGYG